MSKPVSQEFFDGFIAGIEAAKTCAQLLAFVAHLAPSKKDVAEGLIVGFDDAKLKATEAFKRGEFKLGAS